MTSPIGSERDRLIHILVVHFNMLRTKAEEAADLFLHDKALAARRAANTPVDDDEQTPFGHEYGEGPKLADMMAALSASPALPSQMVGVTNFVLQDEIGEPEEWKSAHDELASWTGSAFLAGEKVDNDAELKGELYSFLCKLLGYLACGEIVARYARSNPCLTSPAAEPLVWSIPAHAKWCQPGDQQDKRMFLVRFEDPDCRDSVFTDEAEARAFYAKATVNWNCYLFGALEAHPAPSASREVTFQDRVAKAHVALFHDDPTDVPERVARFYEEATEAVQSLGMSEADAHALVSYTFSRPVGAPEKEIGAAALTLASLCVEAGYDMMACAEADLAALVTPEKIAKVRAKRATRHGRGPLPGLDAALLAALPEREV